MDREGYCCGTFSADTIASLIVLRRPSMRTPPAKRRERSTRTRLHSLEGQIMSDKGLLSDLNDFPESSSAPRSWTWPHGGKHRDFPASRLQARERARQRVQRAIQEERERARRQAENRRSEDVAGLPGTANHRPQSPDAAVATPETASANAAESESSQSQPLPGPSPVVQPGPRAKEPSVSPAGHQWEPVGELSRPAWFASRTDDTAYSVPAAPADTLQGVRDRLASRWFALQGLLESAAPALELHQAPIAMAASATPVLAVFSLAGGVGKTSLVATLARTLSSRGERVLLVETTPYGMLPFFFGARSRRSGVLRTFAPPAAEPDAPVQMIALDADSQLADSSADDPLATEIARYGQNSVRTIIDIATASATVARRVLRMAPLVLVPVVPDMNSVVNVDFIDGLFQKQSDSGANSSEVCYVLNRFDPTLPLHLDVREVLRERLGDRLLPFTLRRAPAVSEALAEGMTVIDYAPNSPVAADFNSLAAWLKARSAPTGCAAQGVRWTER
jgi:cellulose synthase operon protein YhjQ